MISVDLSATLLFNMGIDLFSCMILIIILVSCRKDFADTYDIRLLQKIAAGVVVILIADTFTWVLNGRSGILFRIFGYVSNMLYFVMQVYAACGWLRYAHYRIYGCNMPRKKEIYAIMLPFYSLSFLVVSTPVTKWCFYLDEKNFYHRGILSAPMAIIILIYLASASAEALKQYRREVLNDRRKEMLTIAIFAVPPFLGGIVQILVYGASLVWPCGTVSCLLILLNQESQAVSQDSLTGLNNRRNMEKYIRIYEESGHRGKAGVIMIDINDFKHMNDHYGHNFGDLALKAAADALRSALRGVPAFLCRFGGDEFVIIIPETDQAAAEALMKKIKDQFRDPALTERLPFPLSVSLGFGLAGGNESCRIEDLLKEADENMYRDKIIYHRRQRESE